MSFAARPAWRCKLNERPTDRPAPNADDPRSTARRPRYSAEPDRRSEPGGAAELEVVVAYFDSSRAELSSAAQPSIGRHVADNEWAVASVSSLHVPSASGQLAFADDRGVRLEQAHHLAGTMRVASEHARASVPRPGAPGRWSPTAASLLAGLAAAGAPFPLGAPWRV